MRAQIKNTMLPVILSRGCIEESCRKEAFLSKDKTLEFLRSIYLYIQREP